MPPKAMNKKEESKMVQLVGNSSPASPVPSGPELKQHHSAPSYLQSLAVNDLPPFKLPIKEARPKLLAGPTVLITEEEIVELVAAGGSDTRPPNGLKCALTELIVKKEIIHKYDLSERNFLVLFLIETIDYAAQRDFTAFKLSILFTVYLTTHMYFKWFYWSQPVAIWNYFKELMIRHTIEDSPDGQECFDPIECYDIVTHFHTMYISNLPLIHIHTFGMHRLRLQWPMKPSK